MKKLTAVILICALLFSAVSLAEGSPKSTLFYASDFSSGIGEWQARGGNTLLTAEDGMLRVTQRTKKNDGPALPLAMKRGMLYSISVQVMQDAKASMDITLSIEHGKAGITSYTRIGNAKAPRGEWVTISGEWIAEPFDSYELTLKTSGSKVGDFSVKELKIMVSDPSDITPVEYEGELPSLKELASGLFDVGTCVSQADVRDARRSNLVKKQYNILTPENELKPDAVLDLNASRQLAKEDDTAVAVHFSSALAILNFARDNGFKVHGHVLVWHSQTPEEFFHVGYDRSNPYVTREVMLKRLENYIKGVFEYIGENYPGLFVSWDVANECIADGSSSLRASNWTKVVGDDFVARAFEYADKYAPDGILLYYNDYSTPYEPKQTGIVNLLTQLVAEGHIDGYGFQSHYACDTPEISAVRSAFDRISALGLRLRVSELDMACTADTDSTRALQAGRYGELMKLYAEYADRLDAVQVWGVSDGTSWIREKYPLIFDADLQPKPAFITLVNVLKGEEKQ